jgi:hypothetical protein
VVEQSQGEDNYMNGYEEEGVHRIDTIEHNLENALTLQVNHNNNEDDIEHNFMNEEENLNTGVKADLEKKELFLKQRMSTDGIPLCRICLCEENATENQMISICKCAGTMQYIHVACLKEWIDSKKKFKRSERVTTYLWKGLTCELCKARFPDLIPLRDGLFQELVSYEEPPNDYLVLESVTLQNLKIVHVIDMNHHKMVKIGRENDCDIKVTDISVSRYHAAIQKSKQKGEKFFILLDNCSKFGTLSLLREPLLIQ